LSNQTTIVAKDGGEVIRLSIEGMNKVNDQMGRLESNTSQSAKAVAETMQSSLLTGEAFQRIIGMVNDSANKVTEIAAASEEGSAQSTDILQSVTAISSASEQTAAATQENAAGSQSLSRLAEELNRSVSIFQVE
jgi:methyl-accepting chemotaxis protein